MVNFFTVRQVVRYSTDIYGNYFVAGRFFIAFGRVILRITVPAFIPLEKNNLSNSRTCPYCGAIVTEDALFCEKCNQKLDEY